MADEIYPVSANDGNAVDVSAPTSVQNDPTFDQYSQIAADGSAAGSTQSTVDAIVNGTSTGAPDIFSGNYGGYTTGSTIENGNAGTNNQAIAAQSAYASSDKNLSLAEKLSKMFNNAVGAASDPAQMKNPLALMALTGIGKAQQNSYDKERAATLAQTQADQIAQHAQVARDIVNANSAAISAVPKPKGIIQKALTRIDGTPVFNSNGTVQA